MYNKGKNRPVFLPGKLQKTLLQYIKAQGIESGPVFITRSGRPLDRSNIWSDMKKLCRTARVADAKVFPHLVLLFFIKQLHVFVQLISSFFETK